MEVKWANYYCSTHKILLVGEGDFSFSLSLATAFGSASNIVATSLDSYAVLLNKYRKAESNVEELKRMGATILHEIDATQMKYIDLTQHKFDRIVFNFPHAGFKGKEDNPGLISLHQELLLGFFDNARRMLRHPYGEIHVRHKTSVPFCDWNLTYLAHMNSLALLKSMPFKIEDHPGYSNKRGDGSRSDEPFPLGECSTFMFIHKCHFQQLVIGYMQMKEASREMSPECSYHRNLVKIYGSSSSDGGSIMREMRRVLATQAVVDKEDHLRSLVLLYGR